MNPVYLEVTINGVRYFFPVGSDATCEIRFNLYSHTPAQQQLLVPQLPTPPVGKEYGALGCSLANSLPIVGPGTFLAWMNWTDTGTLGDLYLEVDPSEDSDVFWAKVERKDGQPFVMSNPGNPALNSGTFFHPGPGVAPRILQWDFRNVPKVRLVITFRENELGPLTTVEFVPVAGQNQALVAIGAADDYERVGKPYDDPNFTGSGFDTSYTYSKTGTDFSGKPFVSSPAPILTAVNQTKPRLLGNNYAFARQTALNVTLFKRIPKFTIHPSLRIGYPGGLFTAEDDNDLQGRGFTHISESAGSITDATGGSTGKVPRLLEEACYQVALDKAAALEAQNPSDPRIQWLREWAGPPGSFEGNTHYLICDEAAGLAYGEQWYWRLKNDPTIGPVDGFSINHEVATVNPRGAVQDFYYQFTTHHAYIAKGVLQAAQADGNTSLICCLTDLGNLAAVAPYSLDFPATERQGGDPLPNPDPSIPGYLHYATIEGFIRGNSKDQPFSDSHPLGALVKSGKVLMGVGSYQQHTWDDESLWRKNPDGSYLLDGSGNLQLKVERRTTLVMGQSCTVYEDDPWRGMLKLYGYFARYYANDFLRAGSKHLPLSTDRLAGWEQMKFQRSFRVDTEIDTGGSAYPLDNSFNHRPLNPDWCELDHVGMYLLGGVYLRGWMENQPRTALGADNNKPSKARGQVEFVQKGHQRGANLNWIKDTPWRWVLPRLPLKEQGFLGHKTPNPDEFFWKKPLIVGGLATKDGKPTLWLLWAWPGQDVDKSIDMTVWCDRGNNVRSGSFTCRFEGRKTGLEYWTLPDTMAGIEPRDIFFQYADFKGNTLTYRGDYREAKVTPNPTPPAAAS